MTTHFKEKNEELTWCSVAGHKVETVTKWSKVNCRDCIMARAIEKTRKRR